MWRYLKRNVDAGKVLVDNGKVEDTGILEDDVDVEDVHIKDVQVNKLS